MTGAACAAPTISAVRNLSTLSPAISACSAACSASMRWMRLMMSLVRAASLLNQRCRQRRWSVDCKPERNPEKEWGFACVHKLLARGLAGAGNSLDEGSIAERNGHRGQQMGIGTTKSERAVSEILTLPTTARDSRSMVNAKSSENHSFRLVKTNCGLVIDPGSQSVSSARCRGSIEISRQSR